MRESRQRPFNAGTETARAHGRRRPFVRHAGVSGIAVACVVLTATGWAAAALAQGARSRSVTGPCRGVLHWVRTEGEDGWLKRCRAANGGGMTYGGVTHSCSDWSRLCRADPTYPGNSGLRSR